MAKERKMAGKEDSTRTKDLNRQRKMTTGMRMALKQSQKRKGSRGVRINTEAATHRSVAMCKHSRKAPKAPEEASTARTE